MFVRAQALTFVVLVRLWIAQAVQNLTGREEATHQRAAVGMYYVSK
jgi:hypothetical protein